MKWIFSTFDRRAGKQLPATSRRHAKRQRSFRPALEELEARVVLSTYLTALTTTPNVTTVTLGTSAVTLKDTAALSGGSHETGTLTFTLYLGNTLVDTEKVAVNGSYTTPTGYRLPSTGTVTGTYQWDASYSGDSKNAAASDNNAANEQVKVSPASPTISTSPQPARAVVGSAIADKATVSGGYNPTGTVTFKLYSNSTGSGTPLFTDTETLSGGTATSKGYTATATGTDYWVATYNGDSNNNAVSSGTALEAGGPHPGHAGDQHQPAAGQRHRRQRLSPTRRPSSGGDNPSGTVTFNLYSNSNGSGTPLFTDANVPLVGGVATSTGYTRHRHGHRLLGGHLQRRQQQQRGQQRPQPGAGDHHPGHAGDQHQPAAGQRRRRHLDRRQGHGQRRRQPDRHRHVQSLQQLDRQRHAAVHRHRDALRRHGHLQGLHRHRHRAPITGWPPTTATATTTRSAAAPPASR